MKREKLLMKSSSRLVYSIAVLTLCSCGSGSGSNSVGGNAPLPNVGPQPTVSPTVTSSPSSTPNQTTSPTPTPTPTPQPQSVRFATLRGVATPGAGRMVGGDFDGDGKMDFACLNSPTVRIYYGLGEENFSPPTVVSVDENSSALVAADLNGDGRPDLVVDSQQTDQFKVLFSGTGRTFTVGTPLAAGRDPSDIVVGDWNEDGKPDLAIACRQQGQPFCLFLNDGSGNFSPVAPSAGAISADNIAVTDFNQDGHKDLVVDEGHGVRVYYGNGNAAFTFGPGLAARGQVDKIVAGDLNGDGYPDLVVNPGSLINDGAGGLSLISRDFGYPFEVVDQNLDGKLDVIGRNNSSQATLSLGTGAGDFGVATALDVGELPFSMAVSDFDLDGVPDCLFSSDAGVSLASGNRSSFYLPTPVASRLNAASLVIGDVNGDGRVDLVQAALNRLQVQLALPGGGFEDPVATVVAGSAVRLADVNEDGLLDIVLSAEVRLNQGGGVFGPPTALSVGNQPGALTVGDFSGDGHLDVVVANRAGASVSLLTGNGLGAFTAGTPLTGFQVPSAVCLTDLNNDGRLDLVVADYTKLTAYAGSAAGFTTSVSLNLPQESSTRCLAAADLNKDGYQDLVCGNQDIGSSGDLLVYFGNSSGSLPVPRVLSTQSTAGVAIADINNDGNLDIITAGGSSRVHAIYLGDGAGAFRRIPDVTTGNSRDTPSSVVVHDFNNDSKLDLASPGGNNARTNIYYRR